MDTAKFRYYFTLDGPTTADQIVVTANYNQCQKPGSPSCRTKQRW